jgi:hypothetical protein
MRVAALVIFRVVEKDSVGAEEPVGLPVVDGLPVGVHLGCGVRAAGVEGRVFVLGHLGDAAEHLGGTRLVETGRMIELADCLQQAQRSEGVDVGGVYGVLEGDGHMRLGTEVVHLVGPDLSDQAAESGGIDQVSVVKGDPGRVLVTIDSLGSGDGRSPDHAVDFVALVEKQIGEVRPVLSRYACDERGFWHVSSLWLGLLRALRARGKDRTRSLDAGLGPVGAAG